MPIPSFELHLPIVVVGPGAMGCLFAGLLWEAGNPVWILDKDPERVARITDQGVCLEGIGGARRLPIPITHRAQDIGRAAAVFIWVKSYDTAQAVEHALPLLGSPTYLISLQNGLGNLDILAQYADQEHVLGGTTAQGATLLGPGRVKHAGAGPTQIGQYQKASLNEVTSHHGHWITHWLGKAGIAARWVTDVQQAIWTKLVVNAAINPLTAITRFRNGMLIQIPETRRLLRAAIEETVQVASASGIRLPDDMQAHVEQVCRVTAENVSSMLQDIQRGQRTEIDAINGAVLAKALEWGLAAPVNQVLTDLVKAIESSPAGALNHEPTA